MIIYIKYISLNGGMIKAFKKNQIIIFAIALMLITAGYLSYTMNTEQTAETSAVMEQQEYAGIGDARLVSNDNVVDDSDQDEDKRKSEVSSVNNAVQNTSDATNKNETNSEQSTSKSEEKKAQETSAKEASNKANEDLDAYFTESKLERDKMYSELLETYQSMLANQGVSAEQKNTAQSEISTINKQKNAIMIAENLIKNKGFKDVIIFVNNSSVSAVIRADNIEPAEIAQVQSIIQRELSVNVENIHISNK